LVAFQDRLVVSSISGRLRIDFIYKMLEKRDGGYVCGVN